MMPQRQPQPYRMQANAARDGLVEVPRWVAEGTSGTHRAIAPIQWDLQPAMTHPLYRCVHVTHMDLHMYREILFCNLCGCFWRAGGFHAAWLRQPCSRVPVNSYRWTGLVESWSFSSSPLSSSSFPSHVVG
eukprot:4696840-Pyramimonas_sp.AAC.1